jgi:signal transduction histidine kinase
MNTAIAPLVVGLLLLVVAFGAGGFVWLSRQLHWERQRAETLAAALGTIAGVPYLMQRGRGVRIDGRADDDMWPLELGTVLGFLPEDTRHAVEFKLRGLSASGARFVHRIQLTSAGRVIEMTGHRLTASSQPSMDLVWLAEVSEREAAAAERQRRDQELQLLRTVLDRLPIAAWWRSPDLTPGGGNARFTQLPGLAQAARKLAATARASGIPERGRHEAEWDGARRTLEIVELPAESGGTIGFALDRSEVLQLRAELDRLAAVHRQVLEAVGNAVAIWAPDTRLMFFNQAFERLWGLDHERLAGEPGLGEVLDLLREMRMLPEYADFRRFKTDLIQLFGNLDGVREELLHLPDERTLRLKVSRHPFGGLTFVYEDVTDRLALERSYNTLAEVQRETLDNLFEGIAVFGSDARLRLWNPTFGAMWQLPEADLAARPHASTLIDKIRPLFADADWETRRHSMIGRITAHQTASERIQRRDGSVLEMNAVPLPDGNMLLTYRDMTDTIQVQRALDEKNEALETATRLKSEFISNVTHELRSPLSSIIGFADILTNQFFGELNERQLDYSRGVLESSQRLLSLVDDILDLATLEAGQLELVREPVDVHSLLAGVLAQTRDRAQRLELTLGFDCPTDIGMVLADERRLRQVLFNLVSNAIKFTPASGSVLLSARRVGAEMVLSVSDTGIGIEAAQVGRVFDKFERGDPTTRAVGAGLGLSLVKAFVELHGGRVEIQSAPTRGTTVTCFLPAGSAPPAPRPGSRRRAEGRSNQTPDHPTVQ